MEEKRKSIIIVSVIFGLLFLLIVAGVIQKENEEHTYNNGSTVTYKGNYSTNYEEAFHGEEKKILYIGSSQCGYCSEFTPYMKYLSEVYDFSYYYIDAAEMSNTVLKSILDKVGQDIDDFGTPYVAFLEGGKKIGEIPGYISESSLFDELKENGFIGEDKKYTPSSSSSSSSNQTSDDDSQYTSLSFLDYKKYNEVYESGKKAVIVLGQTGCGACTAYKPIINKIAKEKNIPIYYVNMTELKGDEPYELMDSLSSYFDGVESWGTPLTLIIENKDVVDTQLGSNSEETTLEFLKKNKFIS